MSEKLAIAIVEKAYRAGVREFCLCPGARNYLLADILLKENKIKTYMGIDERSSAFFALGRTKKTGLPTGIITTSGTAAGELLPAAMEAYYAGLPLFLVTADRPRTYRKTGSPQTAEQVNLFGQYTSFQLDLDENDPDFSFDEWSQEHSAHLNVCFEDPTDSNCAYSLQLTQENPTSRKNTYSHHNWNIRKEHVYLQKEGHLALDQFLNQVNFPFVVVGNLKPEFRESVTNFLLHLNAPVFLESISGLREKKSLAHLQITRTDHIWKSAEEASYPIDGILRIGGMPTFRLWRDIEDKQEQLKLFSISDRPFTGISWGTMAYTHLDEFFQGYSIQKSFQTSNAARWIEEDKIDHQNLQKLMLKLPQAECSLVHELSKLIPAGSQVFLGTSLPIREWDLTATLEDKSFQTFANRGLNGIDGVLSTFLGTASQNVSNWALLGDQTTIYDMNSLWFLPYLKEHQIRLVVLNNHGGRIFARKFANPAFQNIHQLSFEYLAKFWGIHYECWTQIPLHLDIKANHCLIEVCPDEEVSQQFWKEYAQL